MKLWLKLWLKNLIKSFFKTERGFEWGKWVVLEMNQLDECKTKSDEIIKIKEFSPDQKVMGGPFKGMTYPFLRSRGSSLFPKILGTYEEELSSVIEEMIRDQPLQMIDLGCAEGYYAIGMACRVERLKVFALDIDPFALKSCSDMAIINNVHERVKCLNADQFSHLLSGLDNVNTIIICDVEGFEKYYIDPDRNNYLLRCNMIVELHECFSPGIENLLLNRFSKTHVADVISSKQRVYKLIAEKWNLSEEEVITMADESRPGQMSWLILKAKK